MEGEEKKLVLKGTNLSQQKHVDPDSRSPPIHQRKFTSNQEFTFGKNGNSNVCRRRYVCSKTGPWKADVKKEQMLFSLNYHQKKCHVYKSSIKMGPGYTYIVYIYIHTYYYTHTT